MAKLFDLAAITEIAEDEITSQHLLSPSTRQVLLACFGLLSNPDNWRDLDEILSDVETDEIDAIISQAMVQIIEDTPVNTLKYTVIEGTTNSDTPVMDMIPPGKLAGTRDFPAYWGFRVGDVLHGVYKFNLSNTPAVTRTAFVNATFAGVPIGGGAFALTAPQLENAHVELETIVTINNYSLDGGTGRMKFDCNTWAQAMIFRPNQELQRHNVGTNFASFFEDTQAISGLGTSWNAAGGTISLSRGFLEVKRIG